MFTSRECNSVTFPLAILLPYKNYISWEIKSFEYPKKPIPHLKIYA